MADKPRVKLTLGATLPTDIPYENVQPIVEVEADSWDEARTIALTEIKAIADRVRSKNPFTILQEVTPVQSAKLEQLTDIDGVKILWDPLTHRYQGNYLSGSAFSHKFIQEFPSDRISGAMASKFGVDREELLRMWSTNAEASTSLGTAIHAALELYGKYQNISLATKGNLDSVTHKNVYLSKIVKKFYQDKQNDDAEYEVFVADEYNKLCGFIDRLKIIDRKKKIARVQDYKTNPDITKKKDILPPFKGMIDSTELGAYWLQLSFYAYILKLKGWTIEGLDIYNIYPVEYESGFTIKIDSYEHEVIDISQALEEK